MPNPCLIANHLPTLKRVLILPLSSNPATIPFLSSPVMTKSEPIETLLHHEKPDPINTSSPAMTKGLTPSNTIQCAPPSNQIALTLLNAPCVLLKTTWLVPPLVSTLNFTSTFGINYSLMSNSPSTTSRPYTPKPSMSAYHGIHNAPIDFLSHPTHPPGKLVVVHEHPDSRASWATNGVRDYFLGPAIHHYRCHHVHVLKTGTPRISEPCPTFPKSPLPF
jgi:hypothetical protein